MKSAFIFYFAALVGLTLFSYGFVDVNFPWQPFEFLYNFVYSQRGFTTIIYIIIVSLFFGFYGWVLWRVKQKKLTLTQIWRLIGLTVVVLFFSFPAFSFDMFNYIATAKVTYHYRENPYITMPIEIPNEPMLTFMHAANKVALYGPVWIGLTVIPHSLGLGNLLATILTFKLFIGCFYGLTVYLIWKLSKHNCFSTLFFALNPLVLIETFISSHNDVVMVFFALWSFYLFSKKKLFLAGVTLVASILIKYATVILLPVYCYLIFMHYRKKTINWQKIWKMSAFLMFVMVLLGPVREELYPWYFIWPLAFISLIPYSSALYMFAIAFSFGLELRFAPFVYFRDWGGLTPIIKKITTFIPSIFILAILGGKKHGKGLDLSK